MEAEMTNRCEWAKTQQADPHLNLSDVIELVSRRHTIRPVPADLKGSFGKGKDNKKPFTPITQFNPYVQPRPSNWQGSSSWQGTPSWPTGKGAEPFTYLTR